MAGDVRPPLRLEWRSPAELAENPANWRRHPEKQIAALTDVIAEVDWAGEQHMTAETLLRHFRVYGCIVTWENVGPVVHPTRLTSRQRQILNQLCFPTPARTLRRILDPAPPDKLHGHTFLLD